LTSIIEKRLCLHKELENQQKQNEHLKSRIGRLQMLSNMGAASFIIAHEINNLLTPVGNYAAMALRNPDDKALTEKALQKTAANCERASRAMNSILRMAGGDKPEKKKVRLAGLVEDAFECLCRDLKKDGITVKIDIPQQLEPAVEPIQIQQVLMNLILNARRAMIPGGGILTVAAQDNPDSVLIKVTDSGCGIEPEDTKRIFDPFFTGKQSDTKGAQKAGAGLGLFFCKEAIEAHGGSITVESQPGLGSTFEIILPEK